MKILLLSPPFVSGYMRNARCDFVSLSGTQWYPILLGYCGAWLEKCGHEVKIIDAPAYNLNHKTTEKIVIDYKPNWLIVYTGRLSEDNDIALTDRLTEKIGCKTIIVGPYASISPQKTLAKSEFAKWLVTGEFELPVQEIIEGKENSKIPNLVYKEGNEIICNQERRYLATGELDQMPFVSRFFSKHLDIYRYKTPSESYPFIDIMTGRGCKWGRCTFCLWVHSYIKGCVYNCRSISNVMEELHFISREMLEVRSVMLQDDTLSEERAIEFCEAKLKSGIKLTWSCYVRGNIGIEALKLMKESGCRNLHVGFESGDDKILKHIRKGITREEMTRFARDAKKAGLQIHGDFAFGFPGETMETIQKTIDWACEIRPYTAQFQLMIPFPDTPFYEELENRGWLKDGTPDYPQASKDQLEKMAKKAYRSFYFSIPYFIEIAKHPVDLFFSRIKTYMRAIPSVFWKRYVR